MPIITAAAVRRGGIDELLLRLDALAADELKATNETGWQAPTIGELRAAQREADRVIKLAVRMPAKPDTLTARLDAVLLHPVFGLVILLGLLFVMFQAVFTWAQPLMELISAGFAALGALVHDTLPEGLLQSFLQDGVISGVGSVIVFLPQILILFLFILLLEDLGYMARAAFLMDRIMGGAGLHGRAFIPLLSSFACAIPGIMATRVIDNPPRPADHHPGRAADDLFGAHSGLHADHLRLHSGQAGVGLRQPAGPGDVRPLCAPASPARSACRSSPNIFFWRDNPTPPFMLELPDYKTAAAAQRRHRSGDARQDVPAARRHHDLLDDGVDLVSRLVSAAAGGRQRAGDRLQPGRHHRPCARTGLGAARLQLADQCRPDPGHGGARGRGGRARHRLCRRGRQGSRGADRPGCWRINGRWRPRCPSWSGTFSRRNAPRRWR